MRSKDVVAPWKFCQQYPLACIDTITHWRLHPLQLQMPVATSDSSCRVQVLVILAKRVHSSNLMVYKFNVWVFAYDHGHDKPIPT